MPLHAEWPCPAACVDWDYTQRPIHLLIRIITVNLSYTLQSFDDQDEAVFRQMLPHQKAQIDAGLLRWKFKDNPAGPGLVCVCRDEKANIVGLNAFQRVCFTGGGPGETLTGYQSMDTFVDPSARGMGVFNNMLETFYERANSDFIYGFPNSSSAKGFFGRQKWVNLGLAPFLIRPLRAGYFLKQISKHLPDFPLARLSRKRSTSAEITRFDPEFIHGLTDPAHPPRPFQLRRDADFLNWRIFDKPLSSAHVLTNSNDAFAAGRITEKHGGKIGYLLEAMGTQNALSSVLKDLTHDFSEQNVDAILAWCHPCSPNYKVLRRAGYLPLPKALRPIKINFGARAMSERIHGVEDIANWYISYLDSDTV